MPLSSWWKLEFTLVRTLALVIARAALVLPYTLQRRLAPCIPPFVRDV
jgi:hypothetical protein